jgi:hypothetical protein
MIDRSVKEKIYQETRHRVVAPVRLLRWLAEKEGRLEAMEEKVQT